MKKLYCLYALIICIFTAQSEIKMVRSQPPAEQSAINIGYISLTKPIEDFNDIVRSLKKHADDPSIDCIVLHINSPGGYPGDSQVIADFIVWAKQTKPVIAFISNSGTSGAYWIAAACTWIIAPETAHIGSIGVVSELPKKNPNITFTAGRYKRPHYLGKGVIDPEDAQVIQERLDLTFDIFCENISKLRTIPVEVIRGLEAQVFLASQAVELGLIDETGTIQQVFDKTVELVSYRKGSAPELLRVIASPTEIFEFAL
jgi:protease-4